MKCVSKARIKVGSMLCQVSFLWAWPQTYVIHQAQQELYTTLSLLVDEFQDLALGVFFSGQ